MRTLIILALLIVSICPCEGQIQHPYNSNADLYSSKDLWAEGAIRAGRRDCYESAKTTVIAEARAGLAEVVVESVEGLTVGHFVELYYPDGQFYEGADIVEIFPPHLLRLSKNLPKVLPNWSTVHSMPNLDPNGALILCRTEPGAMIRFFQGNGQEIGRLETFTDRSHKRPKLRLRQMR